MKLVLIPSRIVSSLEATLWRDLPPNVDVCLIQPPPSMVHSLANRAPTDFHTLTKFLDTKIVHQADVIAVETGIGFLWGCVIRLMGIGARIAYIPHFNPVYGESLLYAFLAGRIATAADCVFAGCKSASAAFDLLGLSSSPTFPFGIDTEIFQPCKNRRRLRSELGLPSDGTVFVYAGRLDCDKRVEELIAAFQRANLSEEARLLVCHPEKPKSGYAAAVVSEMERDNRIVRYNAPPRAKLAKLYSLSDAFVTAALSVNETFGRAPLEAMACGIPSITHRYDGFGQYLAHESNKLVRPMQESGVFLPNIRGLSDAMKDFAIRRATLTVHRDDLARRARQYDNRRQLERFVTSLEGGVKCKTDALSFDMPINFEGLPEVTRNLFAPFQGQEVGIFLEFLLRSGSITVPEKSDNYLKFKEKWFSHF